VSIGEIELGALISWLILPNDDQFAVDAELRNMRARERTAAPLPHSLTHQETRIHSAGIGRRSSPAAGKSPRGATRPARRRNEPRRNRVWRSTPARHSQSARPDVFRARRSVSQKAGRHPPLAGQRQARGSFRTRKSFRIAAQCRTHPGPALNLEQGRALPTLKRCDVLLHASEPLRLCRGRGKRLSGPGSVLTRRPTHFVAALQCGISAAE